MMKLRCLSSGKADLGWCVLVLGVLLVGCSGSRDGGGKEDPDVQPKDVVGEDFHDSASTTGDVPDADATPGKDVPLGDGGDSGDAPLEDVGEDVQETVDSEEAPDTNAHDEGGQSPDTGEADAQVDIHQGTQPDGGGCTDDSFCQDNNPCTEGVCKVDGTCLQVVKFDTPCDDEDPCTLEDQCDSVGQCAPGALWDDDGDGYPPMACGGPDCDDADPLINPLAPELCNGEDDNCDGAYDEVPPNALDCTTANTIDADGLCDGSTGDPTGEYSSAQVIDLGKRFGMYC